jgi:hypothetical protein
VNVGALRHGSRPVRLAAAFAAKRSRMINRVAT